MVAVLHVTMPTDAGVAVYVAGLSADQRARGWDVTVACPGRGWLPDDLAARGIPRMVWDARRSPGAATTGEVLRLRRLIDRVGPDVLHLHSAKAGLAGRLAARGRLPTLFQPHGWSWLAANGRMAEATLAWERMAARWTTLYVCVGDDEATEGGQNGLRGRYCVVRNGVDLSRFEAADEPTQRAARAQLGLPPAVPVAVCVGRVTRQKGQDLLITAWSAVHARHPDARLAIVGTGDLLEPLRRQAPPGVIFLGSVGDPRPWYAAADVVVLPSRWEGLPLTLLEALATGRSVIGTDIPGLAEALPQGTGTLIPAGDTAALAEAIAHRAAHPDLAAAEGRAAARYAAANADIRRTHERLARVTTRLASSRGSGRTPAGTRGWTRDSPRTATPRAGSSR